MRIVTTAALPRTLLAAALLLAASCKQKEEPPAGAASGSAPQPPPTEGSAPRPAEAPPPRPPPKTGPELARAFIDCAALASAGKWDDYGTRCLAASFVGHHVDDEDVTREQILPRLQSARVAFPDLSHEPQLVLVSGRAVVAVLLMKGTNTGPLQGAGGSIPPTKKPLGVLVYERVAMDDEARLGEQWAYTDPGTLSGQLGLRKGAAPVRPALARGAPAPVIAVAADDAKELANLAAVKQLIDALNARTAADVLAGYADTVRVSDQAAPADVRGKQALAQELQARWRAFPDGKLEVSGLWAAGDYVALEGTLTGTQTGPLEKLPPTGKRITMQYADVLQLKDGKIIEQWRFRNGIALARQLGADRAPAAPAPTGPAPTPAPAAPTGPAPAPTPAPAAPAK